MSNEIEKTEAKTELLPVNFSAFAGIEQFEAMQRMAKLLAASQMIPEKFKNNLSDCVIAIELSNRIGASVFAVMQSLYIVKGIPAWSAQFIIAAVNSTNKFTPLRFEITEEKELKKIQYEYTVYENGKKESKTGFLTIKNKVCVAYAVEKRTGERLESAPVSYEMAIKEGWWQKTGSKWQTMPDLMLRYRAGSFFGKMYAPEIFLGMQTKEEVEDMNLIDVTPLEEKINAEILNKANAENFEEPETKPEPQAETPTKKEPKKAMKKEAETTAEKASELFNTQTPPFAD